MRSVTKGERFWRGYARIVVALRFVIVVGWIAAAVAAALLLPSLSSAGGSPLGDIVPSESAALDAQQRAFELFGAAVATDTILVERNPRGLSPQELRANADAALAARDQRLPKELEGIRAAVPLVNARVASTPWREDRTTALTYLFAAPDLSLVRRKELAQAYGATLLRAEPGTRVGITGAGPARLAQFDEIEDVLPVIEIATVAVILLVVAIYFRSLGAPIVTLVTAAAAYIVAVRVLAGTGDILGFSVPQEIEPLLVVLLLGLVTDYTIFFLSEGRRRLLRGEARLEAARRATARMTPIVFTAGILVAGGTLALLAGKLEFFNAFGPGLALSAFIVTIVSITLVPAILAIAGPWLFGRKVRNAQAPDEARDDTPAVPSGGHVRLEAPRRERWRGRMAGPLGAVRVSRRLAKEQGRHPVVFLGQRMLAWRPIALVIALVCIGVMGLAASGVTRADLTVGFVASLPPDSEPRRAGDAAARGFVPGIVAPVDVIFERPGVGRDLPALTRLQAGVARQEGIAAVLGPRETAGTALARFAVTPEGGAARLLVVLRDDPTGADGIGAYKDLRTAMPGILDAAGVEGARVSYGGETPLAEETIDAVLGDLERIAIAILVIGFVLLAIFMRSLVAPIILLFASVLAFAASLGLTALLLPHVLGGDTLTYYVPLVAGVLLVSLGSDYNVFIAGSIREEARRRRLSEAIAVATPAASKAITVAGITLAGTFALLGIIPIRPFRERRCCWRSACSSTRSSCARCSSPR
jgi:RND superfamily putative drug exporter